MRIPNAAEAFGFPEHQVAIAEADNRDGAVALRFVFAQLRINGRYAEAAAHQHHRAIKSSLRIWLGRPNGPMKSRIVSPSRKVSAGVIKLCPLPSISLHPKTRSQAQEINIFARNQLIQNHLPIVAENRRLRIWEGRRIN